MPDDLELRRIQLRRMMQLASRVYSPEEGVKKDKEGADVFTRLRPYLVERGDEVMEAARLQYPKEAEGLAKRLLELVESGHVDKIDGATLYNLFRSLGLRVKIETKLTYVKRGESKDLGELIRQKLK
ncbi:MAG TPA: hypothetical protein EYH45_05395 [Candidatus Caldiarchaeum subterraneum]|uniref:Double-stranded DNA-binding protein n=1 Tax=Caldiarchaeum subterraneum TaxID=311458 RepID=A0A832ZW81_CALS0|nr:hypothetical protein [Aigarchaeota archaeon]HIQ29981.1 hypothetical protein [Candidatus Caldarchaeum subterraneum]